MKISKSKQELARIISENGGWRDGAEFSAQDKDDGKLKNAVHFYDEKPSGREGEAWSSDGFMGYSYSIECEERVSNWHQTILSRAEYFHLYQAPDADGWIEWKGGECPVEEGAVVDVRQCDGHTYMAEAKNFHWRLTSGSKCVAAYRLHKPEQSTVESRLADAVDIVKSSAPALMRDEMKFTGDEVMGERKPTIEQLAADYRNAKDYADRKQQEADDAKVDEDAKLKALELAGEALGLLVSPITEKQEPGLVAAKFTGKFHSAKHGDQPISLDMVCDGCGKRFGHHVGFECRP